MTAYEYDSKMRQKIARYPQEVVDVAKETISYFTFDDDCNCTNMYEVIEDFYGFLVEEYDAKISIHEFKDLIDAICTIGAASAC